jgi:DNA gyrase subunit A
MKLARLKRAPIPGVDDTPDEPDEESSDSTALSPERIAALEAAEQFILTVSERGYGKRSSAYDYRRTGRGGQGIQSMEVNDRNGPIVATFPIGSRDEIMLVSDGGQVIRTGVDEVRIAGRRTQGVTLFKVAPEEKVVSVARIAEDSGNGDDSGNNDADGPDEEADSSAPQE